jgi:uncharacterized protein
MITSKSPESLQEASNSARKECMKPIVVPACIAALAAGLVALKPNTETMPPGAEEKIAAAVPSAPWAKPMHPRRLLVFSKTNGWRHDSIVTGKHLLTRLGEKTGAFEAVISDDLAEFEEERLKTYDAVCFLSTTGNVFLPHPDVMKTLSAEQKAAAEAVEARAKQNLMRFLREGGGFIGIHSATDTCYEWSDYGTMINGYFDGHPWTADMEVSIQVEPGQENHPLVAMLEGKNLEFKEEIYQLKEPYDSKAVHMLLRIDTERTNMAVEGLKRTDKDFGVAWIRPWDKGRVFYTSIGHNHEMFWNPKVVGHYLAGIQWALGDLPAPMSIAK